MMDSKLETLIKVNETRSFTKAAELLSLTQPAVSQHIRQLEQDLGATLFIRGEGPLKLTQEGEIAIKYAKEFRRSTRIWSRVWAIRSVTSPGCPSESPTPRRAISWWRSWHVTAA